MPLSALGFLTIYLLGLFLAIFRYPTIGLYTYLWAFYLHPESRWWGDSLPEVRWSLVAALVTFIATVQTKSSSLHSPWFVSWGARFLVLYVAWMWLQGIWALDNSLHFEGCILFTKYIVLFYLIYQNIDDKSDFMLFSVAHVAGCLMLGWMVYNIEVHGRFEGLGGPGIGDANTFGMHLTTGLFFASFIFLGERSIVRWLAFATIPFILNGIILTQSRGAFLGLVAAGLTSLFLKPRVYRRHVYAAAVLGGILFLILSHDLFWDRMATILVSDENELEASAASRIEIMRAEWAMFWDHPWGVGYRGNVILSPHYMPAEILTSAGTRAAHNTFMAILVDQGFPGVILFVGLLVWVMTTLLRIKILDKTGLSPSLAIYRAALGASLVACFVSGQFSNYLKAEVQIWLIALLAVLSNLCHEQSYGEKKRPIDKSKSDTENPQLKSSQSI